jgi:hypothetical protein
MLASLIWADACCTENPKSRYFDARTPTASVGKKIKRSVVAMS